MRDFGDRLRRLFQAGRPFALVMVVEVSGSSPSPVGQMMAVDEAGRVHGSLSAGCVESEAYHRASSVLESGGRSCDCFELDGLDPLSVSLSCGGSVRLMVRSVRPGVDTALPAALSAIERDEAFALVTALDGAAAGDQAVVRADSTVGELDLGPDAGSFWRARAGAVPGGGEAHHRTLRLPGGRRVLVQWFEPSPRLLLFGANAFTEPLRAQGTALGYRVTVCDPRPVFAADMPGTVVEWPHRYLTSIELDERSAICSLSHDLRFEVPLLCAALRGPAGYVGALGSRQANEQRLAALRRAGCSRRELARLRAPMGLDLGDPSPAGTALAVAAELVQTRTGRTGRPLSGLHGTIHDRPPESAGDQPSVRAEQPSAVTAAVPVAMADSMSARRTTGAKA